MKGIGGPHQFGYNKKVHALHFVFYLPVSVLLALGLHAALKRRFLWAKNAEKLLLPIENRNSQCYNIEEKRGPLKGGLSVEG